LALAVVAAVRGVEHLLDGLRLGQELVERELRARDVVEPLGLRDDQAPLE
jgi:hypothetical protein